MTKERHEGLRLLIADGAERARLAVIPGGKERRKVPRPTWPKLHEDAQEQISMTPPDRPAA